MSVKVKLMLVEDREKWVKTFEEEICKDPRFDYLGYSTTKEHGVDMACSLEPDVVVMDIFLDQLSNREDGIVAAKEIRVKTGAKVVFFTADDENSKLRSDACRISFASGYVRKADYKEYANEIYNAATKSTPLKESIIENVRSQLTAAQNDTLSKIIDGQITKNSDMSGMYTDKAISKHKGAIYDKLGLGALPDKEKEKVLIRIFRNW